MYHLGQENVKSSVFLSSCPQLLLLLFYACNYVVEKVVILNALAVILLLDIVIILEFNSCSDHKLDLFWVYMLIQLLSCTSTLRTGLPQASWNS